MASHGCDLLLLVQVMAEGGLQGQAEFDTEQRLLARLSHGHLVRLLGVVRSASPPLRCLLYELMPGGNVEEQLASEVRRVGWRSVGVAHMLCSSWFGYGHVRHLRQGCRHAEGATAWQRSRRAGA